MAILHTTTEYGAVAGLPAGNCRISVFKGIPYAAPPTGALRWREPQPPKPWTGDYPAYTFPAMGMQFRQMPGSFYEKENCVNHLPISEDCLYLNIWTPAENVNERLPVAIWIHGGGFRTGTGHASLFDGECYAKRGIVFVSFNYRLNGFGFMAHKELSVESEHGVSGNYGMLDQIAALKWVRRNITFFGGDPERITIFGQSSGAMSVQTLVTSPLTKGDIQGAIMQSAGGLGVSTQRMTRTLEEAERQGADFLKHIGISSIAEARRQSSQWLCDQFAKSDSVFNMQMYFAPNVDGYVLPKAVNDAVRAGWHHNIPYIVGSTRNENWKTFNQNIDYDAFKKDAQSLYGDFTEQFLQVVGANVPENILACKRNEFADHMYAGAAAFCEMQERHSRRPSYQYLFSQPAPGDDSGAFHGCEHAYVFQTLLRSWRPYSGEDYELSSRICEYWSNFIKTGNPNSDGIPEWIPYTEESPCAMEFGRYNTMFPFLGSRIAQFQKAFFLKDYNQIDALLGN